jgi:protein O-mannosyl-transferase
MTRSRVSWSVLALVLLTGIAYAPTLRGGFIWDDADHLTQNLAMAAPNGLSLIWSSLAVSRYYPLTLTTFWVERHTWGLSPLLYHAINIVLQAINAVLLYLLLRRLNIRGAWVAAALWAVHPVNVESVAWVTELKNLQSGLFFLLCLLGYLRFEEGQNRKWYVASLVLFAAALLSKPSTVFLPAALLVLAWWQRGRWRKDDLLRVCPFAVLALFMSLLTVVEQQRLVQIEATTDWSLPLIQRFAIAGRALWFYAGKLLWPRYLVFVYPRWQIDTKTVASWLPLLGALFVGAVLWKFRRHRWAKAGGFGLGYYALALLPVLGFLNVYYFRYSFVADHFGYLASMGFIALVVAGLTTVIKYEPTKVLISVVALTLLGWQTWHRSLVFNNDETLWTDTLQKNPNAVLAHNNLGNLYEASGQLDLALFHLQKAAELDPDYAQVHNNLGIVLARLNRPNEANIQFAEALRLKPYNPDAHLNLARLLQEQGQFDQAIQHFFAAMEWRSMTTDEYLQLSQLLVQAKHYSEAIETLRRAHTEVPTHLHLANELAWLLATCPDAGLRHPDEAIQLSEQFCSQTRHRVPELLDTLAASYAAAGRFPEAVQTARQAIDLAEAQNQVQLATATQSRLADYQQQRPASVDAHGYPTSVH